MITSYQVDTAKRMTAIEYLKRYEPNELVRCGNGEFELRTHDSFKINEESSVWHWKSKDIGGKSAIDYLISVKGISFVDAVKALCEEISFFVPQNHSEVEQRRYPFVLPPKALDTKRVNAYLQSRGISTKVIDYCINTGILYESLPYHNAVFVGCDDKGNAKYAALRGTYSNGKTDFKSEAQGSDKQYGFCIPPNIDTNKVAIYEAAPDAMAHASLENNSFDKWRLSLGGIYAPLNGEIKKAKPPVALVTFLRNHPEVVHIEICFDNDVPGRKAANMVQQIYCLDYDVKQNLPTQENMDYADLAKLKKLSSGQFQASNGFADRQNRGECR